MKAALAGLVLALSFTAVPLVHASDWHHGRYEEMRSRYDEPYDERLSERRIANLAYRQGFVEIERIEHRRDVAVVDAVRPNGAVFRLAFDAYDGRLIDRERIGWSRGYDTRTYGAPRGPNGAFEFRFGF